MEPGARSRSGVAWNPLVRRRRRPGLQGYRVQLLDSDALPAVDVTTSAETVTVVQLAGD